MTSKGEPEEPQPKTVAPEDPASFLEPLEPEAAEPEESEIAQPDPFEVKPEESLQLARLDPLRKYLNEIRKFEPLSPEEERRLVTRYRQDGDQRAAYRLITANLKLVVKIARLYNRVYNNVMDLIQEGNIGLLEAVKRFDPYKGTRLPTYATWWIKAYVIKFLLDNFRIVRVGTTNQRRRLLFNLRKEKERLRLQGIEPTPQLIAERLNVSVEDVREIEQNIESGDVSLDGPVEGSEGIRFGDTLQAAEGLIEEKLARGELKTIFNDKIKELSKALSERENVILRERLLAEEPMTLQQIAAQFGVTREAIRLSEKSLVKKIKSHMQEALKGITRVEIGLLE